MLHCLVCMHCNCRTSFGQDAAMIYRKLDSIAVIDQKVMMPMRDGIRLATDIYRPKGEGKYPIVFLELLIILIHG